MALNFPIATTTGETYSSGQNTWVWNGYAWDSLGISTSAAVGSQGSTGPQGPQGYQGNTGAAGAGTTGQTGSPNNGSIWNFNLGTVSSGEFNLETASGYTATFSQTTQFIINQYNSFNADFYDWINHLVTWVTERGAGTSVIQINSLVSSANFGIYTVDGVNIEGSGNYKFSLTSLSTSGSLVDGEQASISWLLLGPTGPQGPAGSGSAIEIVQNQVVYGTGTGITSSSDFTFDPSTGLLNISYGTTFVGTNKKSSIIGGSSNTIATQSNNTTIISSCNGITECYSNYSTIISGFSNKLSYCVRGAVISGYYNYICSTSKGASILGGCGNSMCVTGTNISGNSIIGGFSNKMCQYGIIASNIVGGYNNCLISSDSKASTILGGQANVIKGCNSKFDSIISGSNNTINGSNPNGTRHSSIISGYANTLYDACASTVSGQKNKICFANNSSILGSCESCIIGVSGTPSLSSMIIGGRNHVISNSSGSVIVGGKGVTLTNEDFMVVVPGLKISGMFNDDTLTKVLAWSDDDTIKWRSVSSISASASGVTGPQGATGPSGASFSSPYTGNIQINGQAWASGFTSSSSTINWNNSNVQQHTLTQSTTFAFSNPNFGSTYVLIVKQAAAGGYTVSWPTAVTWTSIPTMTSTANRYDIYTFIYADSKYFGSYLQNFS